MALLAFALASAAGAERGAMPAADVRYLLEADVSMRSIPVDVRFSGARIVLFGSVSRVGQAVADEGPLDVVAVLQGVQSQMTVRRKSNDWGLWLNTQSVAFAQAPRIYAVVSSRPLEAIAPKAVLTENKIGVEQVPIVAAEGQGEGTGGGINPQLVNEFRAAAIETGIRVKAYMRKDTGITFVGTSLFRGEIDVPASTPVGQLDVSVFLFQGGKVVARSDSRVAMAREGFEQWVYEFADQQAALYGVFTVALAVAIGFLSSFIVGLRRPGR